MAKIAEDVDFAKIEEVISIFKIILKEWSDNMKWCYAEGVLGKIELP